jgi:hypothetical protein
MPDLRAMSRDFSLPAVQRWSSFSRHLLRDAKGQIGKPLVGKATKPNGWPKVENPRLWAVQREAWRTAGDKAASTLWQRY